jgi:hypothetical protein
MGGLPLDFFLLPYNPVQGQVPTGDQCVNVGGIVNGTPLWLDSRGGEWESSPCTGDM